MSSEQAAADAAAAEVKRKRKRTKKRKQEFLNQNDFDVYFTGLPGDDPEPTKEEVSQFFAKCGLLKKDDNGRLQCNLLS